jgi:inner membrane protease subunit 2
MSAGQRVFPKASRWRNFVGNPTFWRCVKYGGWLPVAVFVTHNVYSVGNIGGPSMMPTFNPDYYSSPLHSDVVLLERWQVKGSLPFLGQRYRRGDVVTLW